MINITIDGKQIEVPTGTTVLRAAEAAGLKIPTLCDHPKVSPYGGCRLCVVEVEGARTLQPACTLPVAPNMVIHTDTERTREARKFVLTLLFSERNHFCMYCQVSGGDCELQNAAYGEGMTHWPLSPTWTTYPVDASNPYFVLEHNRCILCRRCVRACGELIGNFTLGFEERGAKSILVADLGTPLGESTCISCGTCVQICPTGALIDKRSAYRGKDIQLQSTISICTACDVGCAIDVKTRDNQLVRVDGDWNAPLNDGVLCELGRFKPVFDTRERIVTPMIRKNGSLKAATYQDALALITEKISGAKGKNGSGIAAYITPRLPAEELYLYKRFFDGLNSSTISTLEEEPITNAAIQASKELGKPFESNLSILKDADCVLVLGEDLAKDHQVVGFMIKRILPLGTHLVVVDTKENKFGNSADIFVKIKADGYVDFLQNLQKGSGSPEIEKIAGLIKKSRQPVIVYGKDFVAKSAVQALKTLIELARSIGVLTEESSRIIGLKGQANSLAAALMGYRSSSDEHKQSINYVVLGEQEPTQRLAKRFEGVPFLVVQASYVSPLTAIADVVLPHEIWLEQEGHFVNTEGFVQLARQALPAPDGVQSAQWTIQQLASTLGLSIDNDWQPSLNATLSPVMIQY